MSKVLLTLLIALSCCARIEAGPAEVRQALIELDAWLGRSPHAGSWHTYLGTDTVRQQLARANHPDPAALARTLRCLTGDLETLKAPPVMRLRVALEQWLTTATLPGGEHLTVVADSIKHRYQPGSPTAANDRSTSNPVTSRDELSLQLDSLIPQLQEYAKRPSPVLARQAGEALDKLAAIGQADSLVRGVRGFYRYPNLWVVLSEEVISQQVEKPIDRPTTVNQTILGTRIIGSGYVVGRSHLELVHGGEAAQLKAVVTGTAYTTTRGRNGPAIIYCRATTTFRSEKRILLGENGFLALPAATQAQTSTVVTGIDSTLPRLRGRIVERVASRRVAGSKPQAEAIAARFAEQRVNVAVNRESERLLARFDRIAITPLLAIGGASTTTHEGLWFRSVPGYLLIGRRGPLGSAALPETDLDGAQVSLTFPPGMLSNFAADTLDRTAVGQSWLGKALHRALGVDLFATGAEANYDPWAMTFAQNKPFTMDVLPNGLALTLRGGFSSGGQSYQGIDMTAHYRWANTPRGYRFVRDEPLSFHTSTLERTDRDSVAEAVVKGMLQTWLDRLIPKELRLFAGLKLGRDDNGLDLGEVVRFDAKDDWVTLGYNPPTKRETARQAHRAGVTGGRGAPRPWGALRR
ncbi:MAG: hypothetical protein HY000_02830 [Planctomycetes bacterium]|nr:hypothetical protein [Planctomycetota bacterium]